jgi:hypothetical protein
MTQDEDGFVSLKDEADQDPAQGAEKVMAFAKVSQWEGGVIRGPLDLDLTRINVMYYVISPSWFFFCVLRVYLASPFILISPW